MRFQGKIDIWFWIILFLGEGILLYSLCIRDMEIWLLSAVLLIYNLMMVPLVFRNYVEVEEDRVTVVFGFFKQSMRLTELKEAYRTYSPLSSTAASLDRIVLKGDRKQLLCAVRKREAFFSLLKEKNPQIVIRADSRRIYRSTARKTEAVICIVIFAAAGYLLFTGDITMEYGEDVLTVKASYWPDKEIVYHEIEELRFTQEDIPGVRVNGFGSFRLLLGDFKNNEFGTYIRYTYVRCSSAVLLRVNGTEIVLSGKNEEDTYQIYQELLRRMNHDGSSAGVVHFCRKDF